jgi:hypothetical protein
MPEKSNDGERRTPFGAHNTLREIPKRSSVASADDMSHYEDNPFESTGPAAGLSVCSACFDDIDICEFIESMADSKRCDFCGHRSRTKRIAAPLDNVVEFMLSAINREYERAVNELGWDSAEGGYLGNHFDSHDLLNQQIGLILPNDDDGRLLDILADCLGFEPWCKADPYGIGPDEQLKFDWKNFCGFIKHHRRYFFLQERKQNRLHERWTPSRMHKVVSNAVREFHLVAKMPAGSIIYRARQQKRGEIRCSPYDFGPPPVEFATRPNRMSPAGIVMFYGSEDIETAIAEIDDNPKLGLAVGTFRTTRESAILDFTALPRLRRFFEGDSESTITDRYILSFLHSFVASLAEKVEDGLTEDIEYVPTQVVTEYFRTVFHLEDSSRIDGVRYFSAQRENGKSLVLFAEQDNVILNPSQIETLVKSRKYQDWQLRNRQKDAWLKLVRKRLIRPPK